jgi:hypothetical protein
VTDFPVGAGDIITVTVRTTRPRLGDVRLGEVSMANLTRNVDTSVSVPARPGIVPAFRAAAWIVEAVSVDLPLFSPVAFTDCVASSSNEVFTLAPGGVATNIIGDPGGAESGPRLTRASITSPTTAVVGWNGFA